MSVLHVLSQMIFVSLQPHSIQLLTEAYCAHCCNCCMSVRMDAPDLQNTSNSGYPENIGIYYIKYLGVGRISSKAHKKVLGVRISAKQLRVAISGV